MARPLRIQYPGAVYHVTSRGNERREIFRHDEDRTTFLRILSQSLNTYSVKLHAYILMDNHFHLLVETPLGNLSEFMRHFNITYTGYFNRRYDRAGHLYQGRYKSILVEKEEYLSVLSRYIHLNPIRIKSLEREKEKLELLLAYSWSSLPGYLDKHKRGKIVYHELVLSDYGGDTKKGQNAYRKQIMADIHGGLDVKGEIFGQSIIGGGEFISWVKETFLGQAGTREQPSAVEIRRYRRKETILALLEEETGKSLASLKKEKGGLRRMAMDLLYRYGGLKGPEIGGLFGIDYSAVSQERKRLREDMAKDKKIEELMGKLERRLSTVKI